MVFLKKVFAKIGSKQQIYDMSFLSLRVHSDASDIATERQKRTEMLERGRLFARSARKFHIILRETFSAYYQFVSKNWANHSQSSYILLAFSLLERELENFGQHVMLQI